jgi:hypothetical protein
MIRRTSPLLGVRAVPTRLVPLCIPLSFPIVSLAVHTRSVPNQIAVLQILFVFAKNCTAVLEAMRWTDEVHASRTITRSSDQQPLFGPKHPHANTAGLPLAVASSILAAILLGGKEGRSNRLARLLGQVLPQGDGSGQPFWKKENPGKMAAAAAVMRSEGVASSSQSRKTAGQPASQASGGKKKKGKKKSGKRR